MRRIDPLIPAFVIVMIFGAIKFYRPAEGYRRMVGAWLYQPLCEVPPGREFTVEYYGLLYTGNTSNLLDQRVLCTGAWEKHVLHFLGQTAEALEQADPSKADSLVFVDVGANTGLHSLYMSNYVAAVHAFDPYPPVVEQMRRNVERNQLQTVTIHPVGLGESAARLPFAEPPDSNQGIGSFVEEASLGAQKTGLELEVVVGDAYFASHGIDRVDVMKVDVEGFEKPVLLGLRETLRRHRPILIFELTAEAGVDGLFESRADLESALPENYQLFNFAEWNAKTGSYRIGGFAVDFDAALDQWDTIAAPAELADLLPRSAEPVW